MIKTIIIPTYAFPRESAESRYSGSAPAANEIIATGTMNKHASKDNLNQVLTSHQYA